MHSQHSHSTFFDFNIECTNFGKRTKEYRADHLHLIHQSSNTSDTNANMLIFGILLLAPLINGLEDNSITETEPPFLMTTTTEFPDTTIKPEPSLTPCNCGIFLSGQFKKGSKEPPKGNPALLHEMNETFPCTNAGNKMCTNRCLDIIVKHLPKSANILCSAVERDIHKERAYLFVKNCKDEWVNTNLSAGREYCCKEGQPYKCPIMS